jgi:hypothetical protein
VAPRKSRKKIGLSRMRWLKIKRKNLKRRERKRFFIKSRRQKSELLLKTI